MKRNAKARGTPKQNTEKNCEKNEGRGTGKNGNLKKKCACAVVNFLKFDARDFKM